MLAHEKRGVVAGFASGAYYSVLSGKGHQGRTVQRAKKQLAARLLVGNAVFIVVLSGDNLKQASSSFSFAAGKQPNRRIFADRADATDSVMRLAAHADMIDGGMGLNRWPGGES